MDRVTAVMKAGRVLAGLAVFGLAACDESGNFSFGQPAAREAASGGRSVRLVERDVEAPQVFQKTDMGLWDGRPSLGGVWVAHPDVEAPERVIIRNTRNGKFVIGALFRRQRDVPGPAFQVSSDAASALGLLAGAPQQLNVTALRREETPAEKAQAQAGGTGDTAPDLTAAPEIEARDLDPVTGPAAAAIGAAEEEAAAMQAQAPEAASKPTRPATSLERHFVQVGIFTIEQNARNTATALRQAGMVPTVLDQTSQGKRFWRVLVGPVISAADRAAVLGKIRGIGFADAYPVTN
jgi:cell division septation protein DedD